MIKNIKMDLNSVPSPRFLLTLKSTTGICTPKNNNYKVSKNHSPTHTSFNTRYCDR